MGITSSWLDLLEDLTEKILERLPLSDYIRFGAVCRQWRSIQRHHRLRHSPSPPPLLSLPWFIHFDPQEDQRTTAVCTSPWEKTHTARRLRLPESAFTKSFTNSSPHGWLLMLDLESSTPSLFHFSLLNPISGAEIPLPPALLPSFSYPPVISPPPNCTVFIRTPDHKLFLIRPGVDSLWTQLQLPKLASSAISCRGKLYCISSELDFFVIDPLSTPTVQIFDIDQTEIRKTSLQCTQADLVEFDGEVLLVVYIFRYDDNLSVRTVSGFQVFKAKLVKRMWVRMESLGDRVLVLGGTTSVSLLAAGVGNGVRGNCIYFFQSSVERGPSQWSVFDLGTRMVKDLANPSQFTHRMFVPSLC